MNYQLVISAISSQLV